MRESDLEEVAPPVGLIVAVVLVGVVVGVDEVLPRTELGRGEQGLGELGVLLDEDRDGHGLFLPLELEAEDIEVRRLLEQGGGLVAVGEQVDDPDTVRDPFIDGIDEDLVHHRPLLAGLHGGGEGEEVSNASLGLHGNLLSNQPWLEEGWDVVKHLLDARGRQIM